MNFSFDYFRSLKSPDFILCNPDKRQIAIMQAINPQLTLRFNDLSELTFEIPKHATNARGRRIKYSYYYRLESKRLILVDGVGYFKIMEVNEVEIGLDSYKAVTASSLQVRLNDRGFFMEERVYKFFDPNNPRDEGFCGSDVGEVPSVIGQLYQQLGIQIDPRAIQGLSEDTTITYDDWTVSYVNPIFCFIEGRESNIVRSFTESRTVFGYDFIINHASEIFEAIFVFDFLRLSISIKTVEEVTGRTNIYLSHDNVINELQTTERADEVVTILNCNGSNLDIRSVNPTGTNYIADFSYYMAAKDEEHPKWMSVALSDKIREWEDEVEAATPEWIELVEQLRGLYYHRTELKKEKQFVDLKLFDLRNAIDRFHLAEKGYLLGLTNLERLEEARAIFTAEEVFVGNQSLDNTSIFYDTDLDKNITHICWRKQPQFEQVGSEEFRWTGRFNFFNSDAIADSRTDTFNNNWLFPFGNDVHPIEGNFLYFRDNVTGGTGGEENVDSYCQLIGESVVIVIDAEKEIFETEYQVTGFRRFTVFSNAPRWERIYTAESNRLQDELDANEKSIEDVSERMKEISSRLNLQKFFDLTDTKERRLLRELKDYWIEADFESPGLAVHYNTPPEEVIALAKELLEEGRKHLARVSQPRFNISVNAINFTKIYEFKAFASDLSLGRVITIQKSESVHYYPVLTSMSWNLDDVNDFTLEFSNALKPNSSDFTFMDLVNEGSNTTRKVSANWQNLTKFIRRENSIDELITQPLNRTLRLAQGAMNNQEFIVDDTGILGRRLKNDSQSDFEPEQVRIINNVIIFTDDAWQTAKTALGRIAFTHPIHGEMRAYGLLAEAVVGSLIIGNTLFIANDNNTVSINGNGITIKNAATDDIVFQADSNGNLIVRGFARVTDLTALETRVTTAEANITSTANNLASTIALTATHTTAISGLTTRLTTAEASITTQASSIGSLISLTTTLQDGLSSATASLALKVGRDENNQIVSMINAASDTVIFRTNRFQILPPLSGSSNFTLNGGNMTCTGGNIGGWTITANTLTSGIGVNVVGMSPNQHGFSFWAGGTPSANANAAQPPFRVTRDGRIFATQGYIGHLSLNNGSLTSGNFEINTRISGNQTSSEINFINTVSRITETEVVTLQLTAWNGLSANNIVLWNHLQVGRVTLNGAGIGGANSGIEFDAGRITANATVTTRTRSPVGNDVRVQTNMPAVQTMSFLIYVVRPGTSNHTAWITVNHGSTDSGWIEVNNWWRNISATFVLSGTTSIVFDNGGVGQNMVARGGFLPSGNGSQDIGSASNRWRQIFATNTTISSSAISLKHSVEDIGDKYSLLFDKLRPVTYKFKDDSDDRTHMGLVAEELKAAMFDAGLSDEDLWAYQDAGIGYGEFIVLNISQIQKLKKRVTELEAQIKITENN